MPRTWRYDAVGNLTYASDRDGRGVGYRYDPVDALIQETWHGGEIGPDGGKIISFAHDAAGRTTRASDVQIGRETANAFAYDKLGRLAESSNAFTGPDGPRATGGVPTVAHRFLYDADGRPAVTAATVSSAADAVTGYAYDERGRLTGLRQGSLPAMVAAGHAPAGFSAALGGAAVAQKYVNFQYRGDDTLSQIGRFAGLHAAAPFVAGTGYAYDLAGRLTDLDQSGPGGSPIARYDYDLDLIGRINAVGRGAGDPHPEEATSYAYDAADRLRTADHQSGADEAYDLDTRGNRTAGPNGSADPVGPDNRLTYDGTFHYRYDSEGNLLLKSTADPSPWWDGTPGSPLKVGPAAGDTAVHYTFDHRQRLTSVTTYTNAAGGAAGQADPARDRVEYVYDAFDRLVARRHDAGWDGSVDDREGYAHAGMGSEADYAFDAAGAITGRFLPGLAEERVGGPDAGTDWLLADHLGSVRDVVRTSSGLPADALQAEGGAVELGTGGSASNQIVDVPDPSAAGGAYVETRGASYDPVSQDGPWRRYQVDVEAAGTYKVWLKVSPPGGAIYVKVDGSGTPASYGSGGGDFAWVQSNSFGTPLTYPLSAGTHVVKVGYRTSGVRVDELLVREASAPSPADDSPAVVGTLHLDYDAYGNVRGGLPADAPRHLHGGAWFDVGTDLYHHAARWRDPGTGRFLSSDPAAFTDGSNRYLAFQANPIAYTDPSGLSAFINGFAHSEDSQNLSVGTPNSYGNAPLGATTSSVGTALTHYAPTLNPTYPRGFGSFSNYASTIDELQIGLNALGYADAQAGLQGSSVTGWSLSKGLPFRPESDLDFAVASKSMYNTSLEIAEGDRIIKTRLARNARFGPINLDFEDLSFDPLKSKSTTLRVIASDRAALQLGVSDSLRNIQGSTGRSASMMIFESAEEAADYGITAWRPGNFTRFKALGSIGLQYGGHALQVAGPAFSAYSIYESDNRPLTSMMEISTLSLSTFESYAAASSGSGAVGVAASGAAAGLATTFTIGVGVAHIHQARQIAENQEFQIRRDMLLYSDLQLKKLAGSRNIDAQRAYLETTFGPGASEVTSFNRYQESKYDWHPPLVYPEMPMHLQEALFRGAHRGD